MEELKDIIIKLALFYADTILGVERAYNNAKRVGKSEGWSEDTMASIDITYEGLCDECLKQLNIRASEIAREWTSNDALDDDLK